MRGVRGKIVLLLSSKEDGHGQGGICSVPALSCQHRSGFPAGPAPLQLPAGFNPTWTQSQISGLRCKREGKKKEKRG